MPSVDGSELAGLLSRGSRLRFTVGEDVGDSHYLRVLRDEDLVGVLAVGMERDHVDVDVALEPVHCRSQDVVDILRAVAGLPASAGTPEVRLHSSDHVVRHLARRLGYAGGLRGVLKTRGELLGVTREPRDAAWLASQVAALVGDAAVDNSRQRGGPLGRFAHEATAGRSDMTRLVVRPAGEQVSFTVAVPVSDDVMPETVALAVDTTVAVRRTFGSAVEHVRTLSFDHGSHGMVKGRVAGMAQPTAWIVHLNASLAVADEWLALLRGRAADPPKLPPLDVPAPFTRIDATTAHELWHQIELTWEARDYRTTIQFRRELGGYFGFDTIEHVLDGKRRGASSAAAEACGRLALEVSPYATTNRLEATAEMFKKWWCTVGTPSPLIAHFGGLMERYFRVASPPAPRL